MYQGEELHHFFAAFVAVVTQGFTIAIGTTVSSSMSVSLHMMSVIQQSSNPFTRCGFFPSFLSNRVIESVVSRIFDCLIS